MIVILSDEQLERIEDALKSARTYVPSYDAESTALHDEIRDALRILEAARVLTAA